MTTDLIQQHKVETIARVYQQTLDDVEAAFKILDTAQKNLSAVLPSSGYADLWQRDIGSRRLLDDELPKSKSHVKRQVWQHLFNVTQVKDFMSIKKREELDHILYDGKIDQLPEPTQENIENTFHGIVNSSTDIINEAIKEVFEWLRPSNWDQYKTNKKHLIGKKVIKTYAVDCGFGTRLMYSVEKKLKALENAFTLLDGKGVTHYPNDIITKIQEAMKNREDDFTDIYFTFKWFLNGNLHIQFNRLDLLEKLNKTGGDNSLTAQRS